ncbi:MAG: nucleoside deaminase [Alphaproteobacteria bacterium]|nr:nucleoside deaminase [Alphaproteobacteria bacterium]
MDLALDEARKAARRGEVPVGAVIIDSRLEVIAATSNRCVELNDPMAHAEMLALRLLQQAYPEERYFPNHSMWVTLEPCSLCASAILALRLNRLVFGAYDPKGGAIDHGPRLFEQPTTHWRPDVIGGIRETEASTLLRQFFEARR